MQKIGVLFVCMGNICRSPAAQAIFESQLGKSGLESRVFVDSAGTHAYHVGELPDERMRHAARRRGYNLDKQRARRVSRADFQQFDYVLAMDHSNYEDLMNFRGPENAVQSTYPSLLMNFAPGPGVLDVPDPYYGGDRGFERVLDLVEEACDGLIVHLRDRMPEVLK